MKLQEMTTSARDALTAKRVFTEPVERDGVTIIGAAAVRGGAGGGQGQDEAGPQGEGGGVGLSARPGGAYGLKGGNGQWGAAGGGNPLGARIAGVGGVPGGLRAPLGMGAVKGAPGPTQGCPRRQWRLWRRRSPPAGPARRRRRLRR